MRARLLVLVVVGLAAVAALAPAGSGGPYVPVTATEKQQTRPLVDVTLAVYKSGETWRMCALVSYRLLREDFRTRAGCRRSTRRHPAAPCRTCTFRISEVFGVYPTAAARTQRRKTIVWMVVVKGDPEWKGESGLELRFIRESDRWRLDYILSDGIKR